MKLCLGTVQFGTNYGISNRNGQVPLEEVGKILDYAKSVNIEALDTAYLYGNSEEALGNFNLSSFKVVTKTVKLNSELSLEDNVNCFERAFNESLSRLRLNSVYALLYHEANDILKEDAIFQWGRTLKEEGKVKKLGVSVYTPEQLIEIMERYSIDIVQLPLNILDQRFVPLLKVLKKRGIEVHVRSIFLQGLLLMEADTLGPYFDEIKPLLKRLPQPALAHAINFVRSFNEIDKIVVGTTCLKDLIEIVNAYNDKLEVEDYSKFSISDERFILPQNWVR